MSKFSDKFVDGMSLVAEKVDENKFLGAIKDSFTIYMHRPAICADPRQCSSTVGTGPVPRPEACTG